MKRRRLFIIGAGALLIVIGAFVWLWHNGAIDHTAEVGVEGMVWGEKTYAAIGGEYTEGKTIAKSKDGSWKINEVKEDPSHTFVVARSFLDQCLYVSDAYTIPTSGRVTTACFNGECITDDKFLEAVSQIDSMKMTSFEHETEGIFMLTDTQQMKSLYFAYEDCPVATVNKGWLGKINGAWVITTYISSAQNHEDDSPRSYTVGCYTIPDTYSEILEGYFPA